MQLDNKTNHLKPYHGIGVFILVVLALIFVATPIQQRWGMYGVALTEIMILLFGIIPVILMKTDLREVFPIKKPMFCEILGTLVMWIGSYIAVILITLIIGYFFPEGLSQVSYSLQDAFTSVPMLVAFFIIGIMPAVCEEILHRGLILSSLFPFKNKWAIIISMGMIFGIFHLDLYRFLPTAFLGMVMTYVMIETKNLILPILFHFTNNTLTTFLAFINKSQTSVTSTEQMVVPLNAIATYLIIGAVIPFIFYIGSRLIHKSKRIEEKQNESIKKKGKSKTIWVAVLCSTLLVIVGIVTMGFSLKTNALTFNTSITMDVNAASENLEIPIEIEKSSEYIMNLEVDNERGLSEIKILRENGEEVFYVSCKSYISTHTIELEKGLYKLIVDFHMDDIEEYYAQKGYTYSEKLEEDLKLTGDLSDYSYFKMKIVIE